MPLWLALGRREARGLGLSALAPRAATSLAQATELRVVTQQKRNRSVSL